MKKGSLLILEKCTNMIKEIEGYVWDTKAAERGEDEPLKQNDHLCDALRYAVYTHKISTFDQEAYNRKIEQELRQKNNWGQSPFR